VFATVAVALLYRLSMDLNGEIAKQTEIATNLKRTLQPIEAMQATAFVDVEPEVDGVREYVQHLRERILVSANGGNAARTDLPPGVYPSHTLDNGAVRAGSQLRPPVFIIVCKNTRIAKVVYGWLAEDKAPIGIPPANIAGFLLVSGTT
jgi:hypothetical protein